ncbi:MAG: DUF192 domain-containing protein [Proteobacteria bacterium]|nr:DUF192 domain-containing protein [Pseudomonadota bacterium]
MTAQNRSRTRLFMIAFLALTVGVTGISLWTNLSRIYSSPTNAQVRSPMEANHLQVVTEKGAQDFVIEVMRTDADRAKGLMFRQSMPENHGMLFDFERDQPVTMWMKNTYIPLDMIFILKDGRIHRIERQTEPHSERTISSGAPVRAVLEVNAGVADKLGIKPGQTVLHGMFPAK